MLEYCGMYELEFMCVLCVLNRVVFYAKCNLDDKYRYKRNGILPMLKRNLGVKLAPQRWQDNAADGSFDVVLTFEEKVFDMVIEGWF